jgi:putative ABC transport system permease protein
VVDVNAFLTAPYIRVDDFGQSPPPKFFTLSVEDARAASFRSPLQPTQGYIALEKDANADAIQERVEALLEDNPGISVGNQSDYVEQQAGQDNTFVVTLYVLLGLAIVIAVLGIINTLALSILKRTRELGLVRAVGMDRWQVIQMVTVESVVSPW